MAIYCGGYFLISSSNDAVCMPFWWNLHEYTMRSALITCSYEYANVCPIAQKKRDKQTNQIADVSISIYVGTVIHLTIIRLVLLWCVGLMCDDMFPIEFTHLLLINSFWTNNISQTNIKWRKQENSEKNGWWKRIYLLQCD